LGTLLVVFSLMLADFFDTMGTVVAIGDHAGILDETGNPEHLKGILVVDALAAVAGGLGSASSATGYVESAAGVGEGARTGIASIVTGLGFLLAMFLSPIVSIIPSEAAAPVLVFVGFLMMAQVTHIDWKHVEEGLPAFLGMVLMPFAYSITTGIGAGLIMFCITKVIAGKARSVHPLLWVVALLFVVYFSQSLLMKLFGQL